MCVASVLMDCLISLSRKVIWSWDLYHCDQHIKSFQMICFTYRFIFSPKSSKTVVYSLWSRAIFDEKWSLPILQVKHVIWKLSSCWLQWCKSQLHTNNQSCKRTETVSKAITEMDGIITMNMTHKMASCLRDGGSLRDMFLRRKQSCSSWLRFSHAFVSSAVCVCVCMYVIRVSI